MTSAHRPSSVRRFLLVALGAFVVYNANLRHIASYDSYAAGLLPLRLLTGHGLTLEDPKGLPPYVRYSIVPSRDGSLVSLYPVVASILVTPLYVPAVAWEAAHPGTNSDDLRMVMEKISASAVMAAAAGLMFLVLETLVAGPAALFLTAAYAFGTTSWTTSSQALWQQGTSQLLLGAILLVLVRGFETPGRLALLGVLAALLTANRPTNAVFHAALAALVLVRVRRRSWPFFATSALLGALLVAYNLHHFAHLSGGYGTLDTSHPAFFGHNAFGFLGLWGLLFSNRGLFVFSPFLLLVLAIPWTEAGRVPGMKILLASYAACLYLHGHFFDWGAGYCYGPRYALDGLPILIAAVAPAFSRAWASLPGRAVLAAAVAFAVFLQVVGAFFYPQNDSGNESHGFFTIERSSPVLALQGGPATPDFLGLLLPGIATTRRLTPEEVRVQYDWEALPPPSWPAGTPRTLKLRIENRGTAAWSSLGGMMARGAVRLRLSWYAGDRLQGSELSGRDVWLTWRLPPGKSLSKEVRVVAPKEVGPAVLLATLVQYRMEGTFGGPGSDPIAVAVDVTP